MLCTRSTCCRLLLLAVVGLLERPTRAENIADAEAEKKFLDSIFRGNVTAQWKDLAHPTCEPHTFGLVGKSVLTFGPSRIDGPGANPYFLSLVASDDSFTISMQSALSSKISDNKLQQIQWWDVSAKQETKDSIKGYDVTGDLRNGDGIADSSENVFNGTVESSDSDSDCGSNDDDDMDFEWTYETGNISFTGFIDQDTAVLTASGTWAGKQDGKQYNVSYSFKFNGAWDSSTAKLSVDDSEPSWPDPGIEAESTHSSSPTSATPTAMVGAGAYPLTSGLAVDTGSIFTTNFVGIPTATVTSSHSSSSFSSAQKSSLGTGGIAGVTVGGVAAVALAGGLASWYLRQRKARKQAQQVYPELAYIYTPSPALYDGGYSSPPPPANAYQAAPAQDPYYQERGASELEMREVLMREDDGAPMHEHPLLRQYQWRQF